MGELVWEFGEVVLCLCVCCFIWGFVLCLFSGVVFELFLGCFRFDFGFRFWVSAFHFGVSVFGFGFGFPVLYSNSSSGDSLGGIHLNDSSVSIR